MKRRMYMYKKLNHMRFKLYMGQLSSGLRYLVYTTVNRMIVGPYNFKRLLLNGIPWVCGLNADRIGMNYGLHIRMHADEFF